MKMRVFWVPQVPMEPFLVSVNSVEEGVKIMDVLAEYDKFQYEKRVKPDYCNIGGLEMFDTTDITDGPDGSWVSWFDEETDEDDPHMYVIKKAEQQKKA